MFADLRTAFDTVDRGGAGGDNEKEEGKEGVSKEDRRSGKGDKKQGKGRGRDKSFWSKRAQTRVLIEPIIV